VTSLIRDLSDDEARAAVALKWGMTDPGVIPAWVAEMDYAVAEPIVAALRAAVDRGVLGYPRFEPGGELGEAYAGFAHRHLGHEVDPGQVLATVDVTAGVRLALDVLGADRAPMVLPLPAYAPQLGLARSPTVSSGTCRSPLTATPTPSTWTTSTGCSPRGPEPCCSPTPTTRAATCTPGPSSRGSATSP
jgi:aspartate/methionine/tyrosine aminotransferase